MKVRFFIFFTLLKTIVFSQKSDVQYNFDCLENDVSGATISLFGNMEAGMLSSFGAQVSLEEELTVGEEVYKKIKEKYRFSTDQEQQKKLDQILKKVESQISKPRGFKYQIYVLDTTELNAFTVGGKIFYTTEMLKFCQTNDEIAAVIGHEVGHNELGHINDQLKRIKSAQTVFGEDAGQLVAAAGKLMTTSFNQKNEAHCDMFGVDLSIASSYQGCDAPKLWDRMREKYEDEENIPKFFLSHPYSSERKMCLKNHIKSNYSISCP
jgi:predicted Zn-dependent protease